MHTVFALLCFVVLIHWLIFPYPSGLHHWHCGNLTIAPVPAKQPWWMWINTSFEFIMNDYITTTKQSTTKPCEYFLGYTVPSSTDRRVKVCGVERKDVSIFCAILSLDNEYDAKCIMVRNRFHPLLFIFYPAQVYKQFHTSDPYSIHYLTYRALKTVATMSFEK